MEKITIVGGGAFGVALSSVLCRDETEVCIWGRDQPTVTKRLSGSSSIKDNLSVTSDVACAAEDADMIVLAIPTHSIRSVLRLFRAYIPSAVPIIIASKGVCQKSGEFSSEIAEKLYPRHPIAVLSGPNLASELFSKRPATATIAIKPDKRGGLVASDVQSAFASSKFLVELSNDIVGVQACGAIKNALAIGCGICSGLYNSENALASMIGLSVYEMRAFLGAVDADPETVFRFGGLADLVLSASSQGARNFSFGKQLALASRDEERPVTCTPNLEGMNSLPALLRRTENAASSFPILNMVAEISLNGAAAKPTFETFWKSI